MILRGGLVETVDYGVSAYRPGGCDGVVEGVDVAIGLHRPLRLRPDGVCYSGEGGGLIIGPEDVMEIAGMGPQ